MCVSELFRQTKRGPKKPRKRRGIALVNLAKAHERRKKAREAENSGPEGAYGTTPDNRDDDGHLDGDSECHSNDDGNEGDIENETEVRNVGHQQCAISNSQERPLVTPEVTVILKPENADRYDYEDT